MAQLGQTVSMYQNLNPTNTNINEVAFSGSYTDLSNTPVISTVGHSGQYSDVLNPPTRVSQFANDANYAIIGQKVSEFANDVQYTTNGSNVSQFVNNSNYAVRGENVSEFANNANYTVNGSNIGQFANNSNYAVRGENVSEFNNNAGYITASQVPSNALQVRFQQNTNTGTAANGGQFLLLWWYPNLARFWDRLCKHRFWHERKSCGQWEHNLFCEPRLFGQW